MVEEHDRETPSLEPPSLFGRKRKRRAPAPAPTVAGPAPVPPGADVAVDESPTTIFDDTSEPTADLTPAASPLTPPPTPYRPTKVRRGPWLGGWPAAVVTGLVVGGGIVAATAGSLRLCTNLKGTSSCGGPGFFLLVGILVLAVLLGAVLLRLARVREPGSTSFLGVGLLSVAALLFLVGSIFEWWMAIAIPLISVATFLVAQWVTATFVDPWNDGVDPGADPDEHDVR